MTQPTRIPWNDLADLLASGMKVLEVHQLPNAETLLIVSFPEEENMKLDDVLTKLTRSAQTMPGQVQRITLKNGLSIDAVINGDDAQLQLSRSQVSPSRTEMEVVLKHWPESIDAEASAKTCREFAHHGRGYLQLKIKRAAGVEAQQYG